VLHTTPRVRRATLAAVATVAGIGLLAGCSASGDDTATETGGTLVFAMSLDPTCIDPQQVTVTEALNVSRQVVDSLLDQDPESGEIVPWLAESFEANDDLTAYTFTLRDDVTFSDDTALTSEVVAANFDAIVDLAADGSTASLANQYLAGYTGTDVTDEQTFTVNFSAPNAAFLQGTTTMSLGIVSEATTTEDATTRCTTGVIGSGPFVYDVYTPNDEVSMDAREGYDWPSELRTHTGAALVDRIEFPIITEASVRTGGLESGEFDAISNLPYADESRFEGDEYEVLFKANPGIPSSLLPNTGNPLLADTAVRQAILMGIDRDEVRETVGYPNGASPESALTSATPGFTAQGDALAYDPDAAGDLLAEDGWTAGDDGILERDGERLSFTVTAFYDQPMLELVQMQLAEIGVDLQLNIVTAGDFFGAVASRDYDFLYAALTRTDPDVLRVMLSQQAASHWVVVDDAELESLLTEQASTADATARQGIVDEIQSIVIDNAYLMPVVEAAQLHAATSAVTGIEFDSASRLNLYDVSVSR
jgi:peptide/nickel transport system substrate-binding protein